MSDGTMALLHREGDGIIVCHSRGKKQGWWLKRCTSLTEAEQLCQKWGAEGKNVYVKHALHNGVMGKTKTGKAVPDVHADKFTGSRTFLIDIDAGPNAHYKTTHDAYAAFKHAITQLKAMGVPFPNLINQTGGGFHAGWVVDRVIAHDVWKKLTGILYNLLRGHGLFLDDLVKSIERGVRMCGPGYVNVNHGSPIATKQLVRKPPYSEPAFVNAILKHGLRPVQSYSESNSAPSRAAELDNEEFGTRKQHDLDYDVVMDECKVLNHAMATGGIEDDYQTWMDVLGVVAKGSNEEHSQTYAVLVSDQHKDYDEEYLWGKYDNLRADGRGYTLCNTFQTRRHSVTGDTKMALCTQCRWYKKVNSPGGIQGALASMEPQRQRSEARFTDDYILGTGYFQNARGICRDRAADSEEQDPVVWSNNRMEDLRLLRVDIDRNEEVFAFTRSAVDGKGAQEIHIRCTNMATHLALAGQLSRFNVSIPHHQQKPVFNMMISFMERLRALKVIGTKYTRLGWTEDRTSFVLGDQVYHNGTPTETIPATPDMEHFKPRGDRASYDAIVGRILQGETRATAHAFVASSLGSTLLDLCGFTGIALNFYSPQSGHGKTTISRVCASLWGNPRPMMFTLDDTENSMHHKAGILNNLPTMFDELRLGGEASKRVGSLAFRVAAGQEKSRMTKDARLQEQRAWRAFTIFSTNHSFADLAENKVTGGDAALARVLDFQMPPLPQGATKHAGSIALDVAKLEHINGHVGHEFVQHVVNNREAYAKLLGDTFNRLILRTTSNSGDVSGRNHAAAGAALIIAAQIAAKKKLLPIDPRLVAKAVYDALDAAHRRKRTVQAATVPMALLCDYLRVSEERRIVTQGGGGKWMQIINANSYRRPIAYEINFKTGQIIVDIAQLVVWLQNETHVASSVLQDLAQYRTSGYIGKGTFEQSATKRDVLVLPASTPEFADLFESRNDP
jgi:hypothetical protein